MPETEPAATQDAVLASLEAGAPARPAVPGWSDAYEGLPSGFDLAPGERASIEHVGGAHSATYGELEDDAAARLLRWLAPGPDDVLVDLGSGAGRLLLQAVATTSVGRAVGIELGSSRHALASAARARLAERSPGAARRLVLLHGDLRAIPWHDATYVWSGATCFSEPVVRGIVRRAAEMPRLRRLLSTRRLPPHPALEHLGVLDLQTTWAERAPAFVYAPRRRTRPRLPR